MTSQKELDGLLGSFFAEGPEQVADRVIEGALDEINLTRQRRALRWPRQHQANMLSRLAAAAVIGVLVVGAAFVFSRLAPPTVSSSPSPSVTSTPSEPAVVVPTSSATPRTLIAFIRTTEKPYDAARPCPGDDPMDHVTPPTCPTPRLWIVGSDGSGARELFPDGFGVQSLFGWSPDGTRLLYSDGGKLSITDATGSEPQLVDMGCIAPCLSDDSFALSSDGKHLVFIRGTVDASGYAGPSWIATLDLTSGRVAELSSTVDSGAYLPGWSPDASQIVFSRGADKEPGGPIPPREAALFVVDADGQNLRQITPPTMDAQFGVWSPDGSRIVFASSGLLGVSDIYTIRPDGAEPRRLTSDGVSSGATWTPDGRILFVRRSGLWTMDADGTNAAELAPGLVLGDATTVFQQAHPLWQPTGSTTIVPPPWHPSTGTAVGPPPPTPAATPVPSLAPGFSWTGSMAATVSDSSSFDTATLLTDGRVLVTRSCDQAAQLYDPRTGTFSPAGSMTAPRSGETATRLLDGRVLIAGGGNCGNAVTGGLWASAEIFDPATRTFSTTGSMLRPRARHTATLLGDGRVLIAGGMTGAPPPVAFQIVLASYQGGHPAAVPTDNMLASAELFDPSTGTFSATGSMSTFRDRFTATLLADGQVLIVGGGGEGFDLNTAELYNPTSGTFRATGSMADARWLHAATLLVDGRVLITGGRSPDDATYASAELYDPTSGKFSSAGSMNASRQEHSATLLQDGRVLIAGGYRQDGQNWDVLSAAELYDPATGNFTAIGSMGDARSGHIATLLDDGRVLIAGGTGIGIRGLISLTSAVIYLP